MRDITPLGRSFLLDDGQLNRSIQADASAAAMARVWSRLQSGAPLRIGVLGSSVAMSGGCQAQYQPQLRCAQFDGVQVRKRFARGYGVIDDEMRGLLHNADRPVRGFVLQLLDALNATWPHPGHRIINAAVDAWTAKAIEPCLLSNQEITTSDLLLLELGSQAWHPSQAAASERIVRKLLARAAGPPPAMIMVTTRQWCGRSVHGLRRKERPVLLHTWEGIEDVFSRFCTAYGLACLSMRDAIFHDVLAHRENFSVADVAADCLHPEQSRFGYHYVADVLIHFLHSSWRDYHGRLDGGTRPPALPHSSRLPQPILPGNRGSAGRMVWRCYSLPVSPTVPSSWAPEPNASDDGQRHVTGGKGGRMAARSKLELQWQTLGVTRQHYSARGVAPLLPDTPNCDVLRKCVLRVTRPREQKACLHGRGHWQYCARALAPRAVQKPGIVSMLPGAEMRFVVDTTSPIIAHGVDGNGSAPSFRASLALTYLASYEGMGLCMVSCEHGCKCQSRLVDALQAAQPASADARAGSEGRAGDGTQALARNISIASVVEIPVSSASACVVRLHNRGRSSLRGLTSVSTPAKWKLLQVRVGWDLG